jgi:uncharacterized protein YlxP (DUF503 family)
MVVGILTLQFTLHGTDSLKGKRRVAQSLKQKLRNKFNVATAEVAMQDVWDTLVLAVATVSSDPNRARSLLQKALLMAEAATDAELTGDDIEIIAL